jgi:dihydroxyacetone kinase-like protein
MFRRMARASRNVEQIDAHVLASMMEAALEAVRELGNAQVGDKTLVDTLAPAVTAVVEARDRGDDLVSASTAMVNAAEKGWTSTKELVARVGRSARLGERSRGVLDAGATSCYLLLKSMAESMCGLAANDAESRS